MNNGLVAKIAREITATWKSRYDRETKTTVPAGVVGGQEGQTTIYVSPQFKREFQDIISMYVKKKKKNDVQQDDDARKDDDGNEKEKELGDKETWNQFYMNSLQLIRNKSFSSANGVYMQKVKDLGKEFFECRAAKNFVIKGVAPRIYGAFVSGTNDAVILMLVNKDANDITKHDENSLKQRYKVAVLHNLYQQYSRQ